MVIFMINMSMSRNDPLPITSLWFPYLQAALSGEEWIAPSLAWGGGEEYRKREKAPGHTLPAPPTTIAPRLDPEIARRQAPAQPPPSRPPPRLDAKDVY